MTVSRIIAIVGLVVLVNAVLGVYLYCRHRAKNYEGVCGVNDGDTSVIDVR